MTKSQIAFNFYPINIVSGNFMRIFGFSIEAFRLFHLIIVLSALFPLYGVMRIIAAKNAALLMLVFALPLIYATTYARAISIGFLCVSIAMFAMFRLLYALCSSLQKFTYGCLIFLFSGLAYEGHPYLVSFALAHGLLLTVYLGRGFFSRQQTAYTRTHLIPIVFGAITGTVLFSTWFYNAHIIPVIAQGENPLQAIRQAYTVELNFSAVPSGSVAQRILVNSFLQLLQYASFNPAMAMIGVVSAVVVLRRGTLPQKILVWIWIITSLVFAILLAHDNVHYTLLNVLFVAPLTAIVITNSRIQLLMTVLVWLMLMANIPAIARQPDFSPQIKQLGNTIDTLLPANVIIAAPEVLFWGMVERAADYRSTLYMSTVKAINKPAPDVLITASKGKLSYDLNFLEFPMYAEKWGMVKIYCIPSLYDEELVVYFKPELVRYAKPEYRCP